jgi:hypothetical protein
MSITETIELEVARPQSVSLRGTDSKYERQTTQSVPEPEPPARVLAPATTTPLASQVKLKMISCCLSFFFAGTNDGSLGALLPYMLQSYDVSTGLVIVMYVLLSLIPDYCLRTVEAT